MQLAHELLKNQQQEIKTADNIERLLFGIGDWVWLENKRKKKGEKQKLLPKFIGPYDELEIKANYIYLIEREGQNSWQNECRFKL